MSLNGLVERISLERNCTPELIRAILSDFVGALHETSVKRGVGTVLYDGYWNLTEEGAWHLLGLLCEASQSDRGELTEHYQRMAPELKRFRSILERWKFENRAGN